MIQFLRLQQNNTDDAMQLYTIYNAHTGKDFLTDFCQEVIPFICKLDDTIVSFICMQLDNTRVLMHGFTHKEYQNHGYFSALYAYTLSKTPDLIREFESPLRGFIPMDIKTFDLPSKIQHLADKFGWRFQNSNIFLVKELFYSSHAESQKNSKIRYSYLRNDNDFTREYSVFHKKRRIAKFSLTDLLELGEDTVFFHSFEIRKKYRRQGHATRIMNEIMEKLQHEYRYLYLHVFSENQPALHLYQKLGFLQVDHYDYYETTIRYPESLASPPPIYLKNEHPQETTS